MNWTSEPPKQSGRYYWLSREPECVTIVLIYEHLGVLSVFDRTNNPMAVSSLKDVRWAGPIPEPTEE